MLYRVMVEAVRGHVVLSQSQGGWQRKARYRDNEV